MKSSAPKPLTQEQKAEQIARFLAQKREAFSTGILFNLCQSLGDSASSSQAKALVKISVEMADALIDELYPLPKEEAPADNTKPGAE